MSLGLLLRSHSWLFFTDRHAKHLPWKRMGEVHSLNINGWPFYYRAGLSDIGIIDNILLKQNEYIVPADFSPRVIFDIGANIGAASVYFAKRYPNATIYAFEPVPSNFGLLTKNVAPYKAVKPFQIALGSQTGVINIHYPENPLNFGGFSLCESRSDHKNHFEVPSFRTDDFIKEQGIDKIDLIKIDVEGAEYDILTSMDRGALSQVRVVVGELHGIKEPELLQYIGQWFDISRNQPEKQLIAVNRSA